MQKRYKLVIKKGTKEVVNKTFTAPKNVSHTWLNTALLKDHVKALDVPEKWVKELHYRLEMDGYAVLDYKGTKIKGTLDQI